MKSSVYSVLAGEDVLTAGSNGMPPVASGLGLRMPAIGRSRILPPWRVYQLVISEYPTIRPEPIESVVSLISVVLY